MAIKGGTSPGKRSTTGVKYLHIDVGYTYIARVAINGKHFVVWKGTDKEIGTKVAEKIQQLMLKGNAAFLDWYDYDREDWLKKNGY